MYQANLFSKNINVNENPTLERVSSEFAVEFKLRAEKKEFKIEERITGASSCHNYLRQVWDKDRISYQESFYVMFLNRNNFVIGYSLISVGAGYATVVDLPLIARKAILSGCSGVILSHNHPSGNLKPSQNDEELTEKIKGGLMLFDIAVLDHIILSGSDEKYFSFADEGKI